MEQNFEIICRRKIDRIRENIKGRRVFIWGAGVGGKIVEEVCREEKVVVAGFCDKNADIITEYLGYPVYHPIEMNPKRDYLIVSFLRYDHTMLEKMDEMGYTCNDCFYIGENEGCNKNDIVYKGCKVGRYTYGYEGLLSIFPLAVSIGRYCSINTTARIYNNHPMGCITTHPMLDHPLFCKWEVYDSRKGYAYQYGTNHDNVVGQKSPIRNNAAVTIGNDVWIGANVIILPGVKIGDGAVIAAGAVLARDVEPYAVVGGVPAKVLKYRFSTENISLLEHIKWWEWTTEEIEANIELFYQPEVFLQKMKNKNTL